MISMSWPSSIMPARTSPGPPARSRMRFGPSPCIRSAIPLMLSTTSVTSSSTPGSDENSCSTPSIWTEVMAAPWRDDSSTRRSALPRVSPKPRSRGSATTVAIRAGSSPASIASCFGLMRACQFFWITRLSFAFADEPPLAISCERAGGPPRAGAAPFPYDSLLNTPPLRRTASVVRYRRDVADRGDGETHRLERAQRGLATRTRALDFDLERTHAVIHRLAARVFGGDLRGVWRRLARSLESHGARRRPGNGVALRVGDGDHRVVEGGVDV